MKVMAEEFQQYIHQAPREMKGLNPNPIQDVEHNLFRIFLT